MYKKNIKKFKVIVHKILYTQFFFIIIVTTTTITILTSHRYLFIYNMYYCINKIVIFIVKL